MSKKILVGVDGSPASLKALDYAAQLAQKFDSELVLATVVQGLSESGALRLSLLSEDLFNTAQAELKKSAEKILEEAKARAAKVYGGQIKTICEVGNPSEVLPELVVKEKCDAIIVGYRSASKVSDLLIGSTALNVVQAVKVPVVTIKN